MNYFKNEQNDIFKYNGDLSVDNTTITTLIENGINVEVVTIDSDDYFKEMASITAEEYTEIQNQKALQYWNQSLA